MTLYGWAVLATLMVALSGCSDDSNRAGDPEPTDRGDPVSEASVGALRYTGGESWEPTLGAMSDGSLFFSSSTDVAYGAYQGQVHRVLRSDDSGATWVDVTPALAAGAAFPPLVSDPYLFVDVDTGRVFKSDHEFSTCATLAFSDDKGGTWTDVPIGCGHPIGGHDHQTLFSAKPRSATTIGYDKVVYYCVNRVVDAACARSLDGGLVFGPLVPVFSGQGACGVDGKTDHGVAAPNGRVLLPRAHCGVPMVAISDDDGITWQVIPISSVVTLAPGNHDVSVGFDEAGQAFAAFLGPGGKAYLAASRDGGVTWGASRPISSPDVALVHQVSLGAGAEGRVVVSYMGSTQPYEGTAETDRTWNAYLTLILDATHPAGPSETVIANDAADPVARGACQGACGSVGDFLDVIVDSEGRPWAAFVDVCNNACGRVGGTGDEGTEAFVATLERGPSLRGPSDSLRPLPR